MGIKILVKVGMKVPMDECPDKYWENRQNVGIVKGVDRKRNLVVVAMPDDKLVKFELDGSSWSDCGEFKRDVRFVE